MLTLMASGSVSDYWDTSSLQQGVATAAGVDESVVTISVAAASVIITATIAVPVATTAAAVRESLSSTLGNATAASAALGITVESDPTIAAAPMDSTDDVAVVAIAGGSVGGVLACIMVLLVGVACRAWCMKRQNAKAITRSQATTLPTSVRHDSFNISGDVMEEMSGDKDISRALVVPTPPTYHVAAKASLPVSKRVEAVERHQPDVQKVSEPQSIATLLVACGLEHRVKTFEDDGYTLDNARTALSAGEKVLLKDLRDRKLKLGECRKMIAYLMGTDTSVAGSSEEVPGDKDTARALMVQSAEFRRALMVPTQPAQQAAEVPAPGNAVPVLTAATHSATLAKTPLGLGMTLDPDNIVAYVKEGSQAEREGRIHVGDLVLSLNGEVPPQGKGVTAIIQSLPMGTKLEFSLQSAAYRKATQSLEAAPQFAVTGQPVLKMRRQSVETPEGMPPMEGEKPGLPPVETRKASAVKEAAVAAVKMVEAEAVKEVEAAAQKVAEAAAVKEAEAVAVKEAQATAVKEAEVAAQKEAEAAGQPTEGSEPQGFAAALVACGLEHRVKTFEDDGYTLDNARTALSAGEKVLLKDLRDRKLPLGECRKIISHLANTYPRSDDPSLADDPDNTPETRFLK